MHSSASARAVRAVVVPKSEASALATRAKRIALELSAIEVADQETYERAAERLRRIAEWKRRVLEFFRPMKEQAYRLHRTICERERKILAPVEAAEQQARQALSAWSEEQERRQREMELAAAQDRRRSQKQLRRLAAQNARALGASEQAAMALANALPELPAPAVTSTYEPMQGVTTRQDWHWRPRGSERAALRKLARAAATDDRLLAYLDFNTKALNAAARELKAAAAIPGVEFYPVTSAVIRRG